MPMMVVESGVLRGEVMMEVDVQVWDGDRNGARAVLPKRQGRCGA